MIMKKKPTRLIHAPKGFQPSCKGWIQEAALRMLMNNLDPAVAEKPEDLIVYGGTGKAARNWECFDAIVRSLRNLENDETLLVQSGKPVGIFKTHADAPRVLISNSMLVPKWATWDEFRRLEGLGLTMYGQMTAGSWIYIGTQGILQGTYETLAAAARVHYGPNASLKGKFVLTAGLGEMGGAQPLAVTMNEGVTLVVEIDPWRAKRRLQHRYIDVVVDTLEEAMTMVEEAVREERPLSVGLIGNAADIFPELLERGVVPDMVTDQTCAHDPLMYLPNNMTLEAAEELRRQDPQEYQRLAMQTMAVHCKAIVEMQKRGAIAFDYGNNLRQMAYNAGYTGVKNTDGEWVYPGFVPAYVRPLFCEGQGPFRWVALSGDPKDIYETDKIIMELFPEKEHLVRWLKMAE